MTEQPFSRAIDEGSQESGQGEAGQGLGVLLLLAPQGVTFEGLLQATRNALPGFDTRLTDALPGPGERNRSVRLVLLYSALFPDMAAAASCCRESFPSATLALMTSSAPEDLPQLGELLEEHLIHGLLPLSLQFNTWFAALNLLLNGGEYYPSALVRQRNAGDRRASPGALARTMSSSMRLTAEARPKLEELTTRERQVLELVTEGCQNKLIASRMELSEHTVKVHVHHLIKKLGVHNRTQAAAAYRAMRALGAQPQTPRFAARQNGQN